MSNPHAPQEKLGKYVLVAKIGSGGMAEVYKAYLENHPDIIIAIKRLIPRLSEKKEIVSMLIQEAGLGALLQHPNIVPILDFGMIDQMYFIAMEYIQGKDLKTLLRKQSQKNKQFPTPLALHITSEVLKGLEYAHQKCDLYQRPLQIVHRDISPQNIIVSYQGAVKILDFGIAKPVGKPGDDELGILKGKFSYMSPEQAMGQKIDPRSDLFSAGIVLWELLTLRPCFGGDSDLDILQKVRKVLVRPPHEVNPAIPEELSVIVMKALSKKPSHRYENAGEFLDAVLDYQLERFGEIHPSEVTTFLKSLFDDVELSSELLDQNLDIFFKDRKDISNQPYRPSKTKESKASLRREAPWKIRKRSKLLTHLLSFTKICVFLALIYGTGTLLISDRFSPYQHKASTWIQNLVLSNVSAEKNIYGFSQEQPHHIELSSNARKKLNSLRFEKRDDLQTFFQDLSINPTPKNSSMSSKNNNVYFVRNRQFGLNYLINSSQRKVLINQVKIY